MQKIEIGFSKPINRTFPIGSWLIRLYENTEYSHVYIKIYSKKLDRYLIYEAVGGSGIRFIGLNEWKNSAKEVYSFNLDIKYEHSIEFMQFLIDNTGIKYGFLQNLGVFISNLLKKDKNIWRKGKNCSEAVADLLNLQGITFNKSNDLVTPKDIYLKLQEIYGNS
jgi:hypothetical protein